MIITRFRENWGSLISCLISALFLGLSQPFYAPDLFGELTDNQSWFGMLAFIGYVPLLMVIEKRNLKAVFGFVFLTVTLQYTVVLYWIYIALHVHGHIAPASAAVITLLLPMLLATKAALFLTVARFLAARFNISFFLVVPFAVCAGEYFRNFLIFGGFPWGNVGYSIGRIDELLQIASLIGVYGIVFVAASVNALLAYFFKSHSEKNAYYYLALAISIVIGSYIYGAIRLQQGKDEFATTIRVALLQGDIPQDIKSASKLHAQDILNIYLALHQEAIDQGAELIVWPESSYPRMLRENITQLGKISDDHVASIVGATVYGEDVGTKDKSYHTHNSALLIDYNGMVLKRYDKSHLVPFGEYVPWPMTGMVDKIVPGLGAFQPGTDRNPSELAISLGRNLAVGATVCYEGIFPEITLSYRRNGASLLVNLTNDAWYGFSSAPYQHLLMYKLRSAETGLPFIRATNSGISAWTDSFGRIRQSLGLFERGLLVDNIPLLKKNTLYTVVGDVLPIFSALLLMLGYVFAVFPVITYVRLRQWWKLAIIIVLLAIGCLAYFYYAGPQFITDESARTKMLMIAVSCLLLMIGLLSKSGRSRAILFASGGVIVFSSAILSIFESPYFLFGLAFGLLLYLLAFRINGSGQPVK